MRDANTPIDLVKMCASWNQETWYDFLYTLYLNSDMQEASDVLRRLQMGMDQLVKKKLNTDHMGNWFLRLTTELEQTMKIIYRKHNENPLYDSRNKDKLGDDFDAAKREKKRLDQEFYKQFRKSTY